MFLLFAYDRDCQHGVARAFFGRYDTMEECLEQVKLNSVSDLMDVYDAENGRWYTFDFVEEDDEIFFKVLCDTDDDDDECHFAPLDDSSVDKLIKQCSGTADESSADANIALIR